jgi:hypothetical protein
MAISSLGEAGTPRHLGIRQLKLPGSVPEALREQVHGNRMFSRSCTASMYVAYPQKAS